MTLVNPAYETALALKRLLEEQGLLRAGKEEEEFPYRFFVMKRGKAGIAKTILQWVQRH